MLGHEDLKERTEHKEMMDIQVTPEVKVTKVSQDLQEIKAMMETRELLAIPDLLVYPDLKDQTGDPVCLEQLASQGVLGSKVVLDQGALMAPRDKT